MKGVIILKTVKRVQELLENYQITMYQLAKVSGVPYSTLKYACSNNSQLSVDAIEKICTGLQISMADFFKEPENCV